jgi:uncharacterized DUF497 family protein
VQFEWDEDKREVNIRKHGIDFGDVRDIFHHPMMAFMDNHDSYGEARWHAIGWLETMLGVVVYTERVGDVIRIISA